MLLGAACGIERAFWALSVAAGEHFRWRFFVCHGSSRPIAGPRAAAAFKRCSGYPSSRR